MNKLQKMCYCISGFAFRNCGYNLSCGLRKGHLSSDDLWNEELGDRLKFVFSPEITLCGWLGSKRQLTSELTCSDRLVGLSVPACSREFELLQETSVTSYCGAASAQLAGSLWRDWSKLSTTVSWHWVPLYRDAKYRCIVSLSTTVSWHWVPLYREYSTLCWDWSGQHIRPSESAFPGAIAECERNYCDVLLHCRQAEEKELLSSETELFGDGRGRKIELYISPS